MAVESPSRTVDAGSPSTSPVRETFLGLPRTCFLRIIPDPVVFTYMLGYSIWEVRRRMQAGTEKVEILPER